MHRPPRLQETDLGIGPLAYIPFIIVFLKFNDAAYDTRQSVHKTMGAFAYLFIVINQLLGSGMLLLDAGLFVFASFFFYRAMSENFENRSVAGLVVILLFGALSGWLAFGGAAAKTGGANKAAAASSATEAQLKKALETATKALQQGQLPPDLR